LLLSSTKYQNLQAIIFPSGQDVQAQPSFKQDAQRLAAAAMQETSAMAVADPFGRF
jgi:hypothetical protein